MSYGIFLADDVYAVRQALRWMIEDTPDLAVVGEARDGETAVAGIAAQQPHVVIVDVNLPRQDGFAVARAVKQMPDSPLVIFLSAQNDAPTRQSAFAAGADGFVDKADGWPALHDLIQRLIGAKEEVANENGATDHQP